jgi:D-3-phosphoglycerate dehydrogenase
VKILITPRPFGACGRRQLETLEATGWEIVQNRRQRPLTTSELMGLLGDADGVIAGTEVYDSGTLAGAHRLKVISRVGIGLDNIDLLSCRDRGIRVTYTPDAPSDAVAELTVANIMNLLRHIHESDRSVRERAWNRPTGRLLREVTVGVVGVGRIGSRVLRLLRPFGCQLLAHDIDPAIQGGDPELDWVDLDHVLRNADVVSLHIPLNPANDRFLDRDRIAIMKPGALLINTSRGRVVDEQSLTDALRHRHLGGAALDVFEEEPYEGPLARMDNVVLTAHIGSFARTARQRMEQEAVEDCIRCLRGEPPHHDAIADTFD